MPKYDFDLACRALEHYAQKFEEFENDDMIKLGNSFLKQDLVDNSKKTRELVAKIKDVQTINTIHDNQKLIDVAFTVYLEDLEKSKESLMSSLQERKITEYSLNNINSEISTAKDYIPEK